MAPRGTVIGVRLAAGGVEEDVDVAGHGRVPARYERCAAGWQATFTVGLADAPAVGIEHRLVAATLADARRAVPAAVAYLLRGPVDGR